MEESSFGSIEQKLSLNPLRNRLKLFIGHGLDLGEFVEAFDLLENKEEHDVVKIVLIS